MAPEIFTSQSYFMATDVYAFAIIVLEIFSLETPYKDCNFMQIMAKVSTGFRPKIGEDAPEFFRNLIERCWTQVPENRPSFDDIAEELKTTEVIVNELIDELEYIDYVDYIDEYKSSNAEFFRNRENLWKKEKYQYDLYQK